MRTNLEIFVGKKQITPQTTRLNGEKIRTNLEYFETKRQINAKRTTPKLVNK